MRNVEMSNFEYACWDCSKSRENRSDWFILEVEHRISEEPKFVCPVCGGGQVEKIISIPAAVYVRGDGFLDKKGTNRDMNRYKLKHDDPYGHMREPGEAEELDQKLKNQGKFNQGRTQKYDLRNKTEITQSGNISGRWDEKQKVVIWGQEEEEETDRPDIPSWLPNIE